MLENVKRIPNKKRLGRAADKKVDVQHLFQFSINVVQRGTIKNNSGQGESLEREASAYMGHLVYLPENCPNCLNVSSSIHYYFLESLDLVVCVSGDITFEVTF